jgi:hypothetical protein
LRKGLPSGCGHLCRVRGIHSVGGAGARLGLRGQATAPEELVAAYSPPADDRFALPHDLVDGGALPRAREEPGHPVEPRCVGGGLHPRRGGPAGNDAAGVELAGLDHPAGGIPKQGQLPRAEPTAAGQQGGDPAVPNSDATSSSRSARNRQGSRGPWIGPRRGPRRPLAPSVATARSRSRPGRHPWSPAGTAR